MAWSLAMVMLLRAVTKLENLHLTDHYFIPNFAV